MARVRKTKRDWRWVARDTSGAGVEVFPGTGRPVLGMNYLGDLSWYPADKQGGGVYLCNTEWLKLTGIKVPTDRPIKVRFTAEVVE